MAALVVVSLLALALLALQRVQAHAHSTTANKNAAPQDPTLNCREDVAKIPVWCTAVLLGCPSRELGRERLLGGGGASTSADRSHINNGLCDAYNEHGCKGRKVR